jgi:putative transposase
MYPPPCTSYDDGRDKHLGEIFHELATHKESKIVEGHMMSDHVHIGLDEMMVRAYIRNQEDEDERYDQMRLRM